MEDGLRIPFSCLEASSRIEHLTPDRICAFQLLGRRTSDRAPISQISGIIILRMLQHVIWLIVTPHYHSNKSEYANNSEYAYNAARATSHLTQSLMALR